MIDTKPTYNDVVNRIKECISAFTFTYNGFNCGFDPYYESKDDIMYCDVWYGDNVKTIKGIDNALNLSMFGSKPLKDIFNKIVITEY